MTLRTLVFLIGLCAAAGAEEAAEGRKVRHRLPSLTSVFPQGALPDVKLRAEVLGEYLDRAQKLVFLDDSISGRIVSGSYTRLEIELEIGTQAAWGPHYFRVVSPRGASNLLLFRIGDLPHHGEREPNTTQESAEAVTLPVTINARLYPDGDFDFYRFRAEAGQSWIFDLRAARNGNGLDAGLILLDERGSRLEFVEDRFIWDPFFEFTFERSGTYYAVVQPTHTRNDPNFAYQLDIRQSPYVETITPIAARPGAEVEATLYGYGLRGADVKLGFTSSHFSGKVGQLRGRTATVRFRVPSDAKAGPHQMYVSTPAGRSNAFTFLVDATPTHNGGEVITPPVAITGVARYRDRDRFSFDAAEGQTLVFEVHAHRYGSPVDSILRILDSAGKQVAANDDANFAGVDFNKDSRIVQKFKQAGRYQIEMRNLWATTGEDFPYLLTVKAPQPSVELMLATDQPYVYPGEPGTLKVTASRTDGHESPVPVRLDSVEAEIAAGKNDASIPVALAGAPGTHTMLRVWSPEAAEPAWRKVRLSSGGGEGATSARVDRATLVVAEKPLFSLEALLSSVNLVPGSSAELPVDIRREKGFDEPLQFHAENLPDSVTMEPAGPEGDSSTVRLRFRADRSAPVGRWPRVAILATSASSRTEEAPKISVVVD